MTALLFIAELDFRGLRFYLLSDSSISSRLYEDKIKNNPCILERHNQGKKEKLDVGRGLPKSRKQAANFAGRSQGEPPFRGLIVAAPHHVCDWPRSPSGPTSLC